MAVLHPSKLAVYSLKAVGGVGSAAKYYEFKLQYEHSLQRTSHSMVFGPFGATIGTAMAYTYDHNTLTYWQTEISDKDFICVQSMDGMLSFFEQNSVAFTCYLRNFLVPGPIHYVPQSDCFVTVNSQMVVESYTYVHLKLYSNIDCMFKYAF